MALSSLAKKLFRTLAAVLWEEKVVRSLPCGFPRFWPRAAGNSHLRRNLPTGPQGGILPGPHLRVRVACVHERQTPGDYVQCKVPLPCLVFPLFGHNSRGLVRGLCFGQYHQLTSAAVPESQKFILPLQIITLQRLQSVFLPVGGGKESRNDRQR